MPAPSYERYGLTGNPFRDLSSEAISDVELYHVNLDVDRNLDRIKEEVFEKENRAFVALVGLHGAGKTERLLVAWAEARERKAFAVYFDITTKTTWVTKGLAQAFGRAARAAGYQRLFGTPRWVRDLASLERMKDANYDPVRVGRVIANALNATAPSMLLLNDLHNLSASTELSAFAKALQQLVDSVRPGVIVMFGAYPSFMLQLAAVYPPLSSRINRMLVLPRLTAEEAALLIAKKLLAKRLVDGLDPLYPFDKESVTQLNEVSAGNPRHLLEMADVALEYGVAHRSYRIDLEIVRSALLERQAGEIKAAVDIRSTQWKEQPPPSGPTPKKVTAPTAVDPALGGQRAASTPVVR